MSDFHIKPELRIWHKHAPRNDFILSCKQLINILKERQLQYVLIGGDIFDIPRITADCLFNFYQYFLNPLSKLKVKSFYVNGQHDNLDPPWLSVFDEIIHLHRKTINLDGIEISGLDFSLDAKTLFKEVKSPVLLTHQVWVNFVPSAEGVTIEDIPEHIKLVLTGDFHRFSKIELNSNRYLVSIGPFCHTSSDASKLVDKHVVILNDDLSIECIPILQRPIYRYANVDNTFQIYEEVLEKSQEIRKQIREFDIPDVDIPVVVLEVSYDKLVTTQEEIKELNQVYWKFIPRYEKINGLRPIYQESLDAVDFVNWIKREFSLLYPDRKPLVDLFFTVFNDPSHAENWKRYFKYFEDLICSPIKKEENQGNADSNNQRS